MKKILLTGVGLILVTILAIDFYINRHRANNQENKSETVNITPANAATMPTATTSDNRNEGIQTHTESAIASLNSNTVRHKHRHKGTVIVSDDESQPVVADESVTYNTWDGENQAQPIAVENSKSYFGKVPATNKNLSDKKTRHKRFSLHDNINLGLEIGYNQSSLSNNHTSNMPISRINFGLLVNVNLGDHFAIQPGIRYIIKGNRLQSEVDVNTNEKLSMHYFEVPANLVYKFGEIGDARFMVGAGPYVSYMKDANDEFRTVRYSDASDVLPSKPQYATGNIKKLDWGIGGFVGVQSPEGLFAKVGGEVGMMKIMKNPDGSYSNRNYSIMVSFGYIFGGE